MDTDDDVGVANTNEAGNAEATSPTAAVAVAVENTFILFSVRNEVCYLQLYSSTYSSTLSTYKSTYCSRYAVDVK